MDTWIRTQIAPTDNLIRVRNIRVNPGEPDKDKLSSRRILEQVIVQLPSPARDLRGEEAGRAVHLHAGQVLLRSVRALLWRRTVELGASVGTEGLAGTRFTM